MRVFAGPPRWLGTVRYALLVLVVLGGSFAGLVTAPRPCQAAVEAADEEALASPLPAVSFREDIIPILTRYGCNSGGCHGKLAGQNGFRLSLRGYAPELDFQTITREARGRRIDIAAPERSLLLRKATNLTPHGGGQRIVPGSKAERMLLQWIAAGTPGPLEEEARVVHLQVLPAAAQLAVGEQQALQVTATYSDGRQRDVTWMSQFAAGDASLLQVDPEGVVQLRRPGESVVRVAFQGHVEISTFFSPYPDEVPSDAFAERNNPIDDHVFAKLATLRIEPSTLCDDATFCRRVYLSAIGTLPTPEEVVAFLEDDSPEKRQRLIDALLERPEFLDYWALQLGDLLQNRKQRDHDVRGTKGVRAMHAWIRRQLAAEKSWREITRSVLLTEGSCDTNPAVGYYIVTVGEKPVEQSEVADSVAQAFLGTRIGCAKCHNHPLERYTQDDYYRFMAFFSQLAMERHSPDQAPTVLHTEGRELLNVQRRLKELQQRLDELAAQQDSSGTSAADAEPSQEEQSIRQQIQEMQNRAAQLQDDPPQVRQPRTGEMLSPQPLDRAVMEIPADQDPRVALVDWITSPENEAFAGAIVNRLWKHYLGVGLVEPVDDLRATNPPTNQALWDFLVQEFVQSDYNLKHIMRVIMNSRTFQLSSETLPSNYLDDRYYSHYYARRLPAEVLLDAICQATGEPERFAGYPVGLRAIQLPDPGADSYFLTIFGRSERTTACACERADDVTLPQLLHLQNSDWLHAKLNAPTGRLPQWLERDADHQQVVEQLYLATLSRLPNPAEREAIERLLTDAQAAGDPANTLRDVFWALLNSKEFAFNH